MSTPQRRSGSVNYGAAGLAYFYYRASRLLGRNDLLAPAYAWIERAKDLVATSRIEACYDPSIEVTEQTVGSVALYHTETGIRCVDGLVAAAHGHSTRLIDATEQFVTLAGVQPERTDLVSGAAGLLLECTLLLEAARAAGGDLRGLIGLGQQLQSVLLNRWRPPWQPITGPGPVVLGLAHGWAGLAYAMLRYSVAARAAVPAPALETLDGLADIATWRNGQASWPYHLDGEQSWPGWCHGTAGYAVLWTCAHRVLGDDLF